MGAGVNFEPIPMGAGSRVDGRRWGREEGGRGGGGGRAKDSGV